MAQAGSRNFIQWKTLKTNQNSTCTVRYSLGGETDLDFKILRPRDDSADREGKFPCGRTPGFEGKEFRLPNDAVCDHCIL